MRVLVLGGTAFFGREIVRLFHEAGHAVAVFTRGNIYPKDFPPVRRICGDRKNIRDLEKANQLASWDLVIDNIAYQGTDIKIALQAFPSIKHYILTSTISVYRYSRSQFGVPLDESNVDWTLAPPSENLTNIHWSYARGKLDAEQALRESTLTPWTIFRPTVVYGPNDVLERGFWYLGRMLKGGAILLAGDKQGAFRLAYSHDIATLYLTTALKQKGFSRIYNVAMEEKISLREFCIESAKVLNVRPTFYELKSNEVDEALLGPLANLSDVFPLIDRAKADLDYKATPWPSVARSTALWFCDHWKGDETKLYQTRAKELEVAKKGI